MDMGFYKSCVIAAQGLETYPDLGEVLCEQWLVVTLWGELFRSS